MSRQQLLPTMVMMGLDRIVVTDRKLSSEILCHFQARENVHDRPFTGRRAGCVTTEVEHLVVLD